MLPLPIFSGPLVYVLPAAVVLSFLWGALWYSPLLFGKLWQKEVGMTDKDIEKGNPAKAMVGSFFLMAVMAYGTCVLIWNSDLMRNWCTGMCTGMWLGGAIVAPSMGINALYQGKSFKLWLIDAGYQVSFILLMSGMIGWGLS